MSAAISRYTFLLVAVVVMAIALPQLYDKVFAVKVARTQMFYSPVSETFVFREHFGDHNFIYRDREGNEFDRKTFETLIPFIYYKNMDIWGLLPLKLDGRSFDAPTIKSNRQVFELKPRDIVDNRPSIDIYPLLESNPGRARLRFPEDVFRMSGDEAEFVNVDVNARDDDLTAAFTQALSQAGFRFPARLIAGKATILKPFDEGYFAVDDTGQVFHLKRVDGRPQVVRTPIPMDIDIRHIKVSENKRRAYYGSLLTRDGKLFLISYDGYRLVELPTDGYDPDTMSYKLLMNPLYKTAIFTNRQTVKAVAMDAAFRPIDSYERAVPGTSGMLYAKVAKGLFPFAITLRDDNRSYLTWKLIWNGVVSLIGVVMSLMVYAVLVRWRGDRLGESWPDMVLIAFAGVYGLIAAIASPPEKRYVRVPRERLDGSGHMKRNLEMSAVWCKPDAKRQK